MPTRTAVRKPARARKPSGNRAKTKQITPRSAAFREWVATQPTAKTKAQLPRSGRKKQAAAGPRGFAAADTTLSTTALTYIHAYINYRPGVDWNTCGQAAAGTMLDYLGLNPYNLPRTVADAQDGKDHWFDGDIIDALIRDNLGPDNPFGLGTSVFRIQAALQNHGQKADVSYSGLGGSGADQIWSTLQAKVAEGTPVPVMIDLTVIGGPRFTVHWAIAYHIDAENVYLANCGWKPVVPIDEFKSAWQCSFMPYTFNHCGVFVR